MPAQSIVFAALALFLPVPAAQTAQPAPTPAAAAAAKPDLSGQGTVVEKIASTIRFAKDGSSVRTLAVTEQILSDAGVRSEGILSISFASATDTVTFDSVRVRKLSGELVETPSDGAQEVPMPVTQQAPMYSDLRMKQLPVKSLNVGDTLEYQVTVKSTNLGSPGAFWHTASFTDSMPVKEETIELRVPRELNVLVKSKKVQPAVGDEGGERAYRWKHETASEYPKKQETDKTAAVDTVQQMYDPDIAISSFHTLGGGGRVVSRTDKGPRGAGCGDPGKGGRTDARADDRRREGGCALQLRVDTIPIHRGVVWYWAVAAAHGGGGLSQSVRRLQGQAHAAPGDAGGREDRRGTGADRLRVAGERDAADAVAVRPCDHAGEAEGSRCVAGFDARGCTAAGC